MAGKRSVASASLSSNYRRVTTSFSSTSKSSKISSNRTSGSGKLNSGTSKSSSVSRASKTRADLTAFLATRNLPQMGGGYTSTSATAGKTSSDPASTGTVSSSVPNTNVASAASVAATVSITRGTMLVNNESGSVVKKAAETSIKQGTESRGEVNISTGAKNIAPSAIDDYLSDYYRKDDDVRVKTYVAPKKGYTDKGLDHIGKNNDVFVVTAYNNKEKVTDQIHTVCIAKQKDGSYSIYNANKQEGKKFVAKEGYTSLSDAIKNITNTDPQLICLVAIDDKNL